MNDKNLKTVILRRLMYNTNFAALKNSIVDTESKRLIDLCKVGEF